MKQARGQPRTGGAPCAVCYNPAGNKLYLLCPSQDELLVMDSTFGTPKHILGGSVSTYGRPVMNPALNRRRARLIRAVRRCRQWMARGYTSAMATIFFSTAPTRMVKSCSTAETAGSRGPFAAKVRYA